MLGTPDEKEIENLQTIRARTIMKEIGHRSRRNLLNVFANSNPLAVDLLSGLLEFNPQKRTTVEQALDHPYLHDFYQPDDEPLAEFHFSKYDFDFEHSKTPLRINYK